MRAGHLRLVLLLVAVALGAVAAALVLAVGLPMAERGALGPRGVVAVAALAGGGVSALALALLARTVGGPVARLLAAAEALGREAAELPLLEPPGEPSPRGALVRAVIAFERVGAALVAERARLADKVVELEAANRALVSARERLLRAERLAILGRLAAGIAHEVGNPLGAITGYVELARDRIATAGAVLAPGAAGAAGAAERLEQPERPERPDPAPAAAAAAGEGDAAGAAACADAGDFVARIGAEAARIDRLVRDLLDLARPAEPAAGAIDLAAPLEAALRLARVQPRFRAVAVDVVVPPALPAVIADERRLSQVFLNLLLNAGDATAGAGHVRVAAEATPDAVVVTVADDGPGISAADLPRIFEPFFTTKAGGQGTGLGLAISQGIVESFGGELRAANAPGGGAVLTVRLRTAP